MKLFDLIKRNRRDGLDKRKEEADWTVNFRSLSRNEQVAGGQQRYKSQRDLDSMEEGV